MLRTCSWAAAVKEAAGALGIAESSAWQYLKVVFSKTGTRRRCYHPEEPAG
jgi:DNA-binding CsgD family transcriptional regulator